jgi:protein involved in polysaccharide export with SLBB domain
MNRLFVSIIFLLTISASVYAQLPDSGTLLKIAKEKYGITPDNANISEDELKNELLKRAAARKFDINNQAELEKEIVDIVRERQKNASTPSNAAKIGTQSIDSSLIPDKSKVEIIENSVEKIPEKPTTEVVNNPDADDKKTESVTTPVATSNRVYGQDLPSGISLQVDPKNITPKDSYVIGTGDAFGINVHGPRYASFLLTVNEAGYVSIPEIPGSRMYLRGLTYEQSKKVLRGTLSRIFNLNIAYLEITLNYARTVTVHIMGEVNVKGTQVLTGVNTAFNALAATEGLTDIASIRKIKLVRVGEPDKIVDVYKYLTTPIYGEEFYLRDNDYIIVPPIGKVVEIKGQIKRPHRYELIEGEGLKSLIDYAAGLTSQAYTQNVKLTRIINNQLSVININLDDLQKRGQDFQLLNGDVIEIFAINPSSRNTVELAGEFLYPGQYGLEKGQKLSYYLDKAKLKEEARIDTALITRTYIDGSTGYIKINIKKVLENSNDENNIILEPLDKVNVVSLPKFFYNGNVTLSGEISEGQVELAFDSTLTIRDLIFNAGGLKPNYADKAVIKRTNQKDGTVNYINFSVRAIMDTKSNANQETTLAPFDKITIFNQEEVVDKYAIRVSGDVRKPGTYDFSEDLTIKDLIYLSGGLKPTAYNRIVIIRTNLTNLKKEYIDVDIDALYAVGSRINEEIKLQPSDEIKVLSPAQEGEYVIVIEGEIYTPGKVVWGEGLKLKDVLSMAGGFKPEAANSRLEISRVIYNNQKEANEVIIAYFEIDGNRNLVSGGDFPLERYDKITVRVAPEFKLQQYITISGEVKFPGAYPLLGNNERVSSIIRRSGGLSREAFPEGSKLIRNADDVGIVLLDLEDILDKDDKSVFNYILQPGDEIIIPKAIDLISMSGAIDHPSILEKGIINVPYHKNRRASYYVRKYGQGVDRDKEGRNKFITVTYANGSVQETINLGIGLITPKVNQGSQISVGVVPPKVKEGEKEKESEPIDWNKFLDKTLTQITAVLTMYLLIQRATN